VATWLTRPPWLCTFECSPVLMPQSDRVRVEVWCSSGDRAVEFPVLTSQSNRVFFLFSFLFFFLPMVSQDCSLVFFCYINRNSHCLVRFVKKKLK